MHCARLQATGVQGGHPSIAALTASAARLQASGVQALDSLEMNGHSDENVHIVIYRANTFKKKYKIKRKEMSEINHC